MLSLEEFKEQVLKAKDEKKKIEDGQSQIFKVK